MTSVSGAIQFLLLAVVVNCPMSATAFSMGSFDDITRPRSHQQYGGSSRRYILPPRIRGCELFATTTTTGDNDIQPSSSTSQTTSEEKTGKTTHSLFLFSLPAWNLLLETSSSTNSNTNAHAALLVRRLWEWKDEILGDGRDFFVPRPHTLQALNQLLRQQITNATECVVLSNCARFDVLVVVQEEQHPPLGSTNNSKEQETEGRVRQQLAQALMQQYTHYKESQRQAKKFSLSALFEGPGGGDQPKRLQLEPPPLIAVDNNAVKSFSDDKLRDIRTLTNNLQSLSNPEPIARYLCCVASGLQPQGRRPDRQVVFRPFSSRDAHVMLQLKRTADIAGGSSNNNEKGDDDIDMISASTIDEKNDRIEKQPRIKALLDTALQSGKAARDPSMVPAILPLKKFGSGGSNSRYSLGDAPSKLTAAAAQQAHELAIEPMVDKYVQKWTAWEVSGQIQTFRRAVGALVEEQLGIDLETSAQAKPLRAMLHPHVMSIREGKAVNLDQVLQEIQNFKKTAS